MKFDHSTKQSQAPRHFVRLKDKESIIGVFQGEPYIFYQVWENGKAQLCDPDTEKAQFRFRLNIIVKEGSELVSKIFEQGWNVYSQLKDLNAEYSLDQIFVKITRNGTLQQTTYTIMPMLKQKPDLKKIVAVPLQELGHGKKQESKPPMDDAPMPDEGEMPSFEDEEIPF